MGQCVLEQVDMSGMSGPYLRRGLFRLTADNANQGERTA